MRIKLHAYLDLVRIPNVFTAVADIIAGFIYAGGGVEDWPTLLVLTGASSCLYSGGVVLNDVCDADRDRMQRPDRPIPSGRIARRAALNLAVVLLAVGFALTVCVSSRAAVIAATLVLSIVLYDSVLKATLLAPALMGLCRALNFTMALSTASSLEAVPVLVPVMLIWLYVTSVTFFARNEAAVTARERLLVGTVGVSSAMGGLASLCWIVRDVHVEYLGLVGILGLTLGYRGLATASKPQPAHIQRAVKTFVLSIIGFDACIAWAAGGPVAALAVAVTIVPAVVLGRVFRVT